MSPGLIGWILIALGISVLAMATVAYLIGLRNKNEDELLLLGMILPPISILINLTVLLIFPLLGIEAARLTLWLHRFGIFLMGTFLISGQYLQIEGWYKLWRNQNSESILRTYTHLHYITEMMPAPAALILLFSGLGLIYFGEQSISTGWLFYLLGIFSFMFIDGITHYLPRTRALRSVAMRSACTSNVNEELRSCMKDWFQNSRLFLHYVSFPFVFLLGHLKPHLSNPFATFIVWLESQIRSIETLSPFYKVIPAILWIALVIGLVLVINRITSFQSMRVLSGPVQVKK